MDEPLAVSTPDGRTLTVREGGVPDGVPVLVHHGTPGSSLLYAPHVRDAEARGIRLLSYDRPGYGGSTRNEGRSAADCAADVTAICDALGVERLCTWGVSGGGPHVLATAALLPDRIAAAAALASVAPYGVDGLDFTEGMGEMNVESFEASRGSEEAHRAQHEIELAGLLETTPGQLLEAWASILGPADREVLTGELAEWALEQINAGIRPSSDGWFDDDVVFVKPWGFDVASIRVPVLVWQGEQDKFVPFGHGRWLAANIPGAEARLTAEDGHLTIGESRIGEVHAWLVERF
ncbi:MAG TPA: alpha/beta hydrolase [Gaiellaceae bacterium]